MCSASTTQAYMLLIEASRACFSSCRLTMVVRRARRFVHAWFTAPPLLRASLSSPGSWSTLLPSPARHTEKAGDFPDSRLLPLWQHTPQGFVIGLFLVRSVLCS